MEHILELIQSYGNVFYGLSFVWAFIEGETFVLFAGLAAQKGAINLEALIASAWLGSFLGDQVTFAVGRFYGKRLLDKFPNLAPKVGNALEWIAKRDVIFILSYRFMYGLRNVSSIALGISSIPWRRFAVLNLIASFIWACSFSLLGYLFGASLESVLANEVHGFTIAVLVLFLAIVAVKLVLALWSKRHE